MRFAFGNGSQGSDHYVAFLSSGNNPSTLHRQQQQAQESLKRRLFRWGSPAALVVGVLLVIGLVVLYSPHRDSDRAPLLTSDSLSSLGAINEDDGQFSQGYFVQAFEDFILRHGKVYSTLEEKKHRRDIFARNLVYIDLHNAQNYTYSLAANAFADISFNEFRDLHFTGYRKRNRLAVGRGRTDWSLVDVDDKSLPEVLSWKDKGCVSEIRDQRKCGSCWAFSAAGAVEGAYCLKHGKLTSLSEQQMVDCAGPEGNAGCAGGEMDDAFQYIIDHGGLCTEAAYPYTGEDDPCQDDRCSEVVSVHGFADVPKESGKALKAAVAMKGPVSVAIQADQVGFQFYSSGVFDSPCGTKLNHGVLVVGYGTDFESQKDYWLVKNSWGAGWGEHGFMKLIRNDGSRSGRCGVLLDASFPVVD